jgi:transposase
VERVRAGGMTIVAVADEPGLHETVLRRWVLECGEPGMGLARRSSTAASTAASSGPSPADLAAENARLKRENARLSMERDILRKAALI